jgi:hypothetical protein
MVSIIFGGGKVDITDRPDRKLGTINTDNPNTIVIDSSNVIASNETLPLFRIKKLYRANKIYIFNNPILYGNLAKTNIVELENNIFNVNDIRHSRDLDIYDTTNYVATAGNTATVTIDYGQVLNVKELYVYTVSYQGLNNWYIDISVDNSNWTTIYSSTSAGKVLLRNYTFRYLRFRFVAGSVTFIGSIYKIILTV